MDTREIEFFKKSMQNNLLKAESGGVVLTDFLDEQEQIFVRSLSNKSVQIILEGGFLQAEKNRAMFLPIDYQPSDFKICVFEIIYNSRYLVLNHRKILGGLMSLGIQRKSLGDIFIDGKKAYFACTKEIAPFIKNSFTQISSVPIELEEIDYKIEIKKNWRYQDVTVSSLRLDVIVAAAYHLSRKDISERISNGMIEVNHQICINSSCQLKEQDLISVRHKGRVYVCQIGGKTRSDRIHVQLGFLEN